jgi:hypothetical protein
VHGTSGDEVTAEYSAVACGKERKAFSLQHSVFSVIPSEAREPYRNDDLEIRKHFPLARENEGKSAAG